MGSSCPKGKEGGLGEFVPIGLNGIFKEKCIQLVCEKLTIFQHGQWPSKEIVRFENEVGVYEKFLQNCNSHFMQKSCQAATPSSNLLCDVNVACECEVTLVLDISVLGHFGSWARLVCRIL